MPENSTSTPATKAVLHVFTSADSAADPAAVALIEAQKEASDTAGIAVSTLTLTPDNAKEALAAIFAADRITTWPGAAL